MRIRYFHIFLLTITLLFASCDEENPSFVEGSLAAFQADHPELSPSNQLIACAAGGQVGFLEDTLFPVSVFFLPIPGALEFQYYEAPGDADPEDDNAYQLVDLTLEPVFNGYLQRFLHPGGKEEVWGKVVYQSPDSLHISNAIRIKLSRIPSEFAPQLVEVDLTQPTEPVFSWQDGRTPENAIYFQVVSDSTGNLLSGTYTFDTNFQFYRLDNVVLNIRDVSPAPELVPGARYTFTLMGVSLDNWVNLIAEKTFVAQ